MLSYAYNPPRHTVLHDITDDAKFVEVATTAFGTERLLERDLKQLELVYSTRRTPYLNIIDVVAIPGSVEESVAKAHNEDVLDHFLTQVVVNTEDFLFLPVRIEGLLQGARAL